MEINSTIKPAEMTTQAQRLAIDMTRYIPATVIIALIGLFAILGNGMTIAIYVRFQGLRDSTMKFILNLAITDFSTGVCCLFFMVSFLSELQQLSSFTCLISYQTLLYQSTVSQCLILVTTFERYLAICRREKYPHIMTEKASKIMILASWVFPSIPALIPLLGVNKWDAVGVCSYPRLLPGWLFISYSVLMFLLTLLTIGMYTKILLRARRFYKTLKPSDLHGVNANTTRNRAIKKSIRNGKVIGVVTMFFIACWLPYYIYLIRFGLEDPSYSFALVNIAYLVGISNCTINPIIYGWQKENFRKQARNILTCIFRRRQMNNSVDIENGDTLNTSTSSSRNAIITLNVLKTSQSTCNDHDQMAYARKNSKMAWIGKNDE
ncbi:hypothetical protein FSP39_018314 [Pinctada imbricata]|uniref:G-protein coupled receptors family 1 profile domain-containing protein n=1 Tax=Pinctada imbricata TaxID=66713 RepID=A0AA89CB13_PINIB|nr:hypothetical protein FSP39_018314 [Pinctada imbricata]